MERLVRAAERTKPVVEVLAYGLAALWVAVQLLVRDCNGEFLPAGDAQITSVRRVTLGQDQRVVFDVTFTTKRAAWRVEDAGATLTSSAAVPSVGPTEPAGDGCDGSLAALQTFARLEPDTPFRVSCMSGPVDAHACYRVRVAFTGQRSLLLIGTHLFAGAPTTASAEATTCPGDPNGSSGDDKH